ncbi:hypothetical protein FOZ60_006638 [Perkinsus olseni]|uniref:Uncharacterized protein n=1 Tax=Perkinsus olseni TaxID=32597 RepID=A0A7J6NPD1_PEROL|nr:hypothetical protein FOZ60_006638 [Perkinsus olseni]
MTAASLVRCPSIVKLRRRFDPSVVAYASRGDLMSILSRAQKGDLTHDDDGQRQLNQLEPAYLARLCKYFIPVDGAASVARYRLYPARAKALAESAVDYQAIYSDIHQLLDLVEALAQPAAIGAISPITTQALERVLLTRLGGQCSASLASDPDISVRFIIATCKLGCTSSELLSLLRGEGLSPSSLALCLDTLMALPRADVSDHCEAIVDDLRAQTRLLLSSPVSITIDTNPVRVLNLFARAPGGTTPKSQAFLRFLASQRISSSIAANVEVDDWVKLASNLGFIVGNNTSATALPTYAVRLVLLLVRETYPRLRSLSAEQLIMISSGLWSKPIKYTDDLYSATLVEAILQYSSGLSPQQWMVFLEHVQRVHVSLQRKVHSACRAFVPSESLARIFDSDAEHPTTPTLGSRQALKARSTARASSEDRIQLPRLPPRIMRISRT